jgi:tyrosine-protein kinase Etk/Wzc
VILAATLLTTALGGFLAWRAAPVYEAEALLQLPDKKASNPDPSFAKVEGLYSEPSSADAEVEVLKSDRILGQVVSALKLDLAASPRAAPVIGAALMRRRPDPPSLAVDLLDVPERSMGNDFHVTAGADGSFRWSAPDGTPLASGRPGETLSGRLGGAAVRLRIRSMAARPGQDFLVRRNAVPACIASLRKRLEIAERVKDSNVIGLSVRTDSPAGSAAILNAIIDQYVRYQMEKKAGQANQARAILEARTQPLRVKLDASEGRLDAFRSQHKAVDVSREADSLLEQSAALASQISALVQKRQEVLRTYRADSDVVATIDQQIRQLRNETRQVESQLGALPATQQEMVRLSRDIQVNTELYTSMLNSIQQLQISGDGDAKSVAVVDQAMANPEPVGPKLPVQYAFFAALGALAGIGLVMLRELWGGTIKDHRLIESELGLPVLVTIPHSRTQEAHAAAMDKNRSGPHLLAVTHPDDLAIESLRSLRTAILFSRQAAARPGIMIAAPSPGVGKSFLCANLAILLAQNETRVLLVDADLRRGGLHRYFGFDDRQGGLSDVLSSRTSWPEVVRRTGFPGLDLVSTGSLPGDAAQLLLSPALDGFLAEASRVYTHLIFDVPPLLPVTDGTILGTKLGTLLLVAKSGAHSLDELRLCEKRMEEHGIALAGCIFNDLKPTGLGGYRYAYHYAYK